MKNIRLVFWAFFLSGTVQLHAQLTLTEADMPVVGDTILYAVDTLIVGLEPGMAGADQSWDFTQLGVTFFTGTTYILPEDAPMNESFPTANLVQQTGEIYNYTEVSSEAVLALGAVADFVGTGETFPVFFDFFAQ